MKDLEMKDSKQRAIVLDIQKNTGQQAKLKSNQK